MPDSSVDYTRCHTYGHAWFEADSDWFSAVPGSRATPLTLRCDRCTTERRETIGSTGNLETRYYVYPPDYRYGRNEKPTKEEFRLALLALRLKEARQARRNGVHAVRAVR